VLEAMSAYRSAAIVLGDVGLMERKERKGMERRGEEGEEERKEVESYFECSSGGRRWTYGKEMIVKERREEERIGNDRKGTESRGEEGRRRG